MNNNATIVAITICNLIKDMFILVGMSYLYWWQNVAWGWWILALALVLSDWKPKCKKSKEEQDE